MTNVTFFRVLAIKLATILNYSLTFEYFPDVVNLKSWIRILTEQDSILPF